MDQSTHHRAKPVRLPVANAPLPPIFRMVGVRFDVIPVDERDLEVMAARRVRLMTSRPPVELGDERRADQ